MRKIKDAAFGVVGATAGGLGVDSAIIDDAASNGDLLQAAASILTGLFSMLLGRWLDRIREKRKRKADEDHFKKV